MKFFYGKSYPHPVLRYASTDYRDAEFQVDIDLTRKEGSTQVSLAVEFNLSEQTLLDLVGKSMASYVAMVKCSKTFSRLCIESSRKRLVKNFRG